MKRFLLLSSTLFFAFNLSAQNYDSYLQRAYTALEEGKIEVAQSSYNIYTKMTGRTDLDFETLLKDKIDNDWAKSCYIIDLGDGYCLAAQIPSSSPVTFEAAKNRSESSRLGGFKDWRLPSEEELNILYVSGKFTFSGYLWISYKIVYTHSYGEEELGKSYYTEAINMEGDKVKYITIDFYNKSKYPDVLTMNGVVVQKRYGGVTLPKHRYIVVRRFKK